VGGDNEESWDMNQDETMNVEENQDEY